MNIASFALLGNVSFLGLEDSMRFPWEGTGRAVFLGGGNTASAFLGAGTGAACGESGAVKRFFSAERKNQKTEFHRKQAFRAISLHTQSFLSIDSHATRRPRAEKARQLSAFSPHNMRQAAVSMTTRTLKTMFSAHHATEKARLFLVFL